MLADNLTCYCATYNEWRGSVKALYSATTEAGGTHRRPCYRRSHSPTSCVAVTKGASALRNPPEAGRRSSENGMAMDILDVNMPACGSTRGVLF